MGFLSQPITLQSLFGSKRMIDDITVQVIINEETNDTLTITKQPVQQGASITDHAFKEPTILSMSILAQDNGLSDILPGILNTFNSNGLAAVYDDFLELQESRVPFDVITPKRIYRNMLMGTLRLVTDKATEKILSLNFTFQQIIIVTIGIKQISPLAQSKKQVTQSTQKTGKKSAALTGTQAVAPNTVGAGGL